MNRESGFVLYDPKADRYLGIDGIAHVYASAARVFRTVESAAKQQEWWRNKRFSEIRPIYVSVGKPV